MNEVRVRVDRNERVLVTTLTKKMSEDLTDYLLEMGFRVRYLHSEVDTLERIQIIRDLRLGEYDVLVGVNLLREGLDLPEVSLVAILDADKEGFLRGETSLIQTIGRAARNVDGTVLMYADKETAAMRAAIVETDRRREIQLAYNEEHGITAASIVKGVSDIAEFLQAEQQDAEAPPARRAGEDARTWRRPSSSARSSSSRRRCSPPPRSCASSTPHGCATSCASCAASSRPCGRWGSRPSPRTDARVHDALLDWYARERRDLPWRRTRDPVRDPRLGGDAPADAGRARRAALRGVARALADERRARAAPRARTSWPRGSGLGYNTRARAAAARPAASSPATAGRGRGGPARAARRRAVHGGGGRVVRVRRAGRRGRHERAPRRRAARVRARRRRCCRPAARTTGTRR